MNEGRGWKPYAGPGLLVLLVALPLLFPQSIGTYFVALMESLLSLGGWGLAVVAVLYVFACVLLLPGSIITMGAGVLAASLWPEDLPWALAMGTVAVSAGSTTGAVAAFLIGRTLGRGPVSRWAAGNARFAALDRAIAANGFKMVLLVRLSPVFPFNFLNYALGLSAVPLRDYFLASWLGMLPGALMYVYLGATAQSLAAATASDRVRSPVEWAFLALGLVVTIAVVVYVTRVARRALETGA